MSLEEAMILRVSVKGSCRGTPVRVLFKVG